MNEPNPVWMRTLDYSLFTDEDLFMILIAFETVDRVPGSTVLLDTASSMLRMSQVRTEQIAHSLLGHGLILASDNGYQLNPQVFAEAIAKRKQEL